MHDLQQGRMVILTDDPDRENEGDFIMAAEKITPETMNFIIRNSSGIVCLSLLEAQMKKLGLTFMVPQHENTSVGGASFMIPIDAKNDITTGVSAADRVKTIQVAIQDNVLPEEVVKPGHVFPLQAKSGGVLERAGHTEGAVDLVRLAGFKPAAVLAEVMNPDGTMAQGQQLEDFARINQIKTVSIADLMSYCVLQNNRNSIPFA